ncbi:MAG: YdcF family protein [Rhizobiales bacterium]|nr:YdcF family protein [Hyphomicrobiales bacterium]
MFFYASKIVGFFTIPSNFIILVGIVGALLLRTRFSRAGWPIIIGSLILLAVVGLSPVGNALIVPLEGRFPAWDDSRGAPHGIVVLGGAISPDVSHARNTVALNEAGERLTEVAQLAKRYPDARIIFSGGSAALVFDERPEAEFALRLLEDLGVARDRVVAEDRSRNTVENALFSRELAQPKPGERWLLVTSSYHLPRAIGVFRKAGFPVEAYPVDWRTRGAGDALRPFPTLGDGLRRTDTAVREWIGLVAYWLSGRTSELFPGPLQRGECDRAGQNAAQDNCRP